MKRFIKTVFTTAAATAVVLVGTTVPSHADTAQHQTAQPSQRIVQSRHSGTQNDDGTVTITATVTGSSIASATAVSTSEATGSSYAFAVAWATSHAKIDKSKCKWSTGVNTYWSGGVFHRYYDPVKAHVCKLVHPVTVSGQTYYWKKIGGGTSGANCGNLFVPMHKNVSYTRVAFLDVRAGTVAKVKVHSKVCVTVGVLVNVELQYTYQGETHTVTKQNSASAHKCKTAKDVAKKRVTKHTTRRASAKAIAKARARVQTKATAKATARAKVSARKKAVATVSVTIVVKTPNPAPQLLSIDTINDVLVNNTRTITPQGKVPADHTAELFCKAGPGTITEHQSQTVSGSFSAPITYKAPSEGGTDQVTCTLTQDDGQSVSISTNVFNIVVPNPDPQ